MNYKLPDFFECRVQKPENKNSAGRVRSKEHVPGNWPTILFIPINLSKEEDNQIKEKISSLFSIKFESTDAITSQSSYHLSLSRTIYVKDHQKDLFHRKISQILKKTLKDFPLPEKIKTEAFSVYLNDEKTRTFIAVDIENNETVLKYIEAIDEVLKDFGLPVYYSSPKLHFSIFWCQGNRKNEINFDKKDDEINLEIDLNQILIKCGNKISRINP